MGQNAPMERAKGVALLLLPNAASAAVMAATAGRRPGAGAPQWCPRTPITPPPAVFAVVWPLLYLLVGAAMARMEQLQQRGALAALFVLVAALNAWYAAFSPRCRPGPALGGILATLALAVLTTCAVWQLDAAGGALLVPLCLWLAFASLVSAWIVAQQAGLTPPAAWTRLRP